MCSGVRVRRGIRTSPCICLCSAHRFAACASKPPSGAAGDANGLIADPGLRTSVYSDACSGIRVRSGNRTTRGICAQLGCAGGVAAQAAVSRQCGDSDPSLITSVRSNSRPLRQTPWYCRNAHHNHSKFNRCNLSHIVSLRPTPSLFERHVFHPLKYSARAEPGLLRI